ncbi:MAG: 5-amino-6-(D-ribitylamino)uracil--L-tyrosine 4-hydroxyphenyl transferase CofH [Nitrososphaeraceae archaeon]|jgi:FO synthase subunit 2|nr:5-amino-6-(D-ribitylamino)uracil--L-tyrosine 4-hydroxyphenyl transferase CofH [Nitrososphaeraceae archaeon]MDW0168673.1 5-amino-6-(D-ribitylamino)uracil--L-tyrosine 4-hydroxyphenyl transferase CofH [Nitrososphaeraceae archaeon]MDW0172210.1 5-amino-6-(D-ribitylamino)uracil--L-tyrosine 4-hydroxyphenyl transferase CofH [Nitrososphaeraceae archaeon]MDW0172720.1 5-amino-6-(D-ribitylamino)uracil--L-tyrosine 4-hydroxyphenyl transferase CofH [Nitrososphaeraceae archaeon]MDW0175553.1 5-amino-6-(D-rib
MLESILRDIDPVISDILNQSLDSKNISIKQAIELFETTGTEMIMTAMVADNLRRNAVGDNVTFVINRNINFTNVCIKRCGFCAYSRDFRNEESYFLPTEEVVRRAREAWNLGATEICIQAGLPPKMDGFLYVDICKAIKKELPNIHIHAFSPEEIMYGSYRSGLSVKEYLRVLKESGLGSLPGTAAEILDQDVRDLISPGRITVADWINVITTAHKLKIPTTSTIMYGHVETMEDRAKHLDLLRSIQKQTNGFTEFVPLSFVHKEAPMYNHNLVKGIAPGPTGQDVIKMHAVSRIMLNNFINNIQVSWVKEGAKMSQLLLEAGVNDFGGTLINESISTSAGSEFGQLMRPKEIRSLIQSAGRVPAQRNSVYGIIKVYDGINDENESLLDSAETTQFGSYHELIKLDKFRYKRTK